MSAAMECNGEKSSSCESFWESLPGELWGHILGFLDLVQDYIRFGAVCKSWKSIALAQKLQRLTTIAKTPPLLLIPTPDKSEQHRNLYSICEQKIYNCRLEIPCTSRCCGSSYGWWAVAEKDLSVTLLNPFSKRKTIHLPVIDSKLFNVPFLMGDGTYKVFHTSDPERDVIQKVVLSCDPSVNPDGFVVAVYYDDSYIAFIRSGEQSWTYVNQDFGKVNDLCFHQGMLYAVTPYNQLIAINYRRNPDALDVPDLQFPIAYKDRYEFSYRSYLVSSSNGDLLRIRRMSLKVEGEEEVFRQIKDVTGEFRIYKLSKIAKQESANKLDELEWAEIEKLESDDAFFVGDNQSMCIPKASRFPNCTPNSVYFTDDYWNRGPGHNAHDMGVFDFDDGRKISKILKLSRSLSRIPPAATWISATLLFN